MDWFNLLKSPYKDKKDIFNRQEYAAIEKFAQHLVRNYLNKGKTKYKHYEEKGGYGYRPPKLIKEYDLTNPDDIIQLAKDNSPIYSHDKHGGTVGFFGYGDLTKENILNHFLLIMRQKGYDMGEEE
jgi:hypothetical protein